MEPTHFDIETFEGALPLRFGMSTTEVAERLGPPWRADLNWQKTLTWNYFESKLNLCIGFSGPAGTIDHLGFGRQSLVRFREQDLFGDRTAWRQLVEWSNDRHLWVGILLLCDLGIAVTGLHDNSRDELSVSAFLRGKYDLDRAKFKRYELPPISQRR